MAFIVLKKIQRKEWESKSRWLQGVAWGKGFKTEKFDDALIISGVVVLVDIKSMALDA